MKDKKILFGTFIALLLLLTTGLSYAYFSTSVSGNENAKNVVVEAGTLKLTYTDGPEIKVQNIKPGWSTTKEVTVKNTGTLDTAYNIVWQSLTNEITNNEMRISATCEKFDASGTLEGLYDAIDAIAIKDSKISTNISIKSGATHKYTFTIHFKEMNADQNYNQGKKFDGVLGIEEYVHVATQFEKDDWSTIVSNVKSGNISAYNLGDTKEVNLGSTYGKQTVRIANTSTPSECSTDGFSQTACGFVLEFADIIAQHKMCASGTKSGGWPATTMRTFVNNDIYNALPSELKSAIIDTTVVTGEGTIEDPDEGTEKNEIVTSTDKLYLLAPAEIWSDWKDSNMSSYDPAINETRQLDYYKTKKTTMNYTTPAIKKKGNPLNYWALRSIIGYYDDDPLFFSVDEHGNCESGSASEIGVSPAFRLG